MTTRGSSDTCFYRFFHEESLVLSGDGEIRCTHHNDAFHILLLACNYVQSLAYPQHDAWSYGLPRGISNLEASHNSRQGYRQYLANGVRGRIKVWGRIASSFSSSLHLTWGTKHIGIDTRGVPQNVPVTLIALQVLSHQKKHNRRDQNIDPMVFTSIVTLIVCALSHGTRTWNHAEIRVWLTSHWVKKSGVAKVFEQIVQISTFL